jgi:hypothetical protein
MKYFQYSCFIFLICLIAVNTPMQVLAAQTQTQTQTQVPHVLGNLNFAIPNACAQVFVLTKSHAFQAPGGRSAPSIRQTGNLRNKVVTELAQLAIAIKQATTDGNFAQAKVLRRHLIERFNQAISIGIDLGAFGVLIKKIKMKENEALSEGAKQYEQTRKQIKDSERHFLPWVTLRSLAAHTGWVRFARFSPDGSRIVTASYDKTARIWDALTGKCIATLTGHNGLVLSGHFSTDGLRIITAADDKTARIWDALTGSLIATLTGHTDTVRSAYFSPDGLLVVTASDDKTVKIWVQVESENAGQTEMTNLNKPEFGQLR